MPSLIHTKHRPHAGAGVPWRKQTPKAGGRSYVYGSYVDELLATQTSASNNDISGYTLCANEWESFALPSTCDVAYGAKGSFVFRSAQSGTITFNNATFGDPVPGTPKKGYYRLSGGQRFYAHANHLYSVAALTNQAGAVVERYRYDTYGNRTTLAPDGITTRAVSSYNQQVGFTGRFEDKETKLLYFRARYYSGSLGRFVNRDPLGYVDGWNLYLAYQVPNYVDPFGLEIKDFTFGPFWKLEESENFAHDWKVLPGEDYEWGTKECPCQCAKFTIESRIFVKEKRRMFHEGKVHFRVTSGDAGYVLPLNIATTAIGFIPLFGDAVSVLELIRGGLSDDTVISAAEAWFEKTGRVKGYIKYDIVKRLRLPNKRKFVECLKTGALDELECNYYRDDAKEDHDEDIEETIDAFEDKYQDQIFDN